MKKVLNFEGAVKVDYPENGGLHIGGVSMNAVRNFLEREFATKEEQSVIYGCGTPVQWRVRVTIEAERPSEIELNYGEKEVLNALKELHQLDGPGVIFGPTRIATHIAHRAMKRSASWICYRLKTLLKYGLVETRNGKYWIARNFK